MIQPLWRTVCKFLKKLKIELPYNPAIPLLGIYPEKTLKHISTAHSSIAGKNLAYRLQLVLPVCVIAYMFSYLCYRLCRPTRMLLGVCGK